MGLSAIEIIGKKLIELAEKNGHFPWEKPWSANRFRSKWGIYSFFNQIFLSSQFEDRGLEMKPYMITYKQAQEMEAWIDKQYISNPLMVVGRPNKRDRIEKCKTELALCEEGSPEWYKWQKNLEYALSRSGYVYYKVYSVSMTNMSDERAEILFGEETFQSNDRYDSAEQVYERYPNKPALIHNNGLGAHYAQSTDTVAVPQIELFKTSNHYYATLFHELVHSTGHRSRLDRDTLRHYVEGRDIRGREELIAETGAYMLCNLAGVEPDGKETGSYLKSWLGTLKNDPQEIVHACYKAQAAINYITGESQMLKEE